MVKSTHLQSKTTKIYSNNSVYAPNGLLLFRCSQRKLNWYLNKQLAELIPARLYDPNHEDSAKAIRLLLEPRGTGRNRAGDEWYLEDQKDKCVVCGREGIVSGNDEDDTLIPSREVDGGQGTGLTLHHVVPYQYRREMPLSFKSHGSHDVLAVCVSDHEHYEKIADGEKLRLSQKYDAPLTGKGWLKYPMHSGVRAAGAALLRYTSEMPPERIEQLRNKIVEYYNLSSDREITDEILEATLDLKSIEKGPGFREHGEIVVQSLMAEEGEEGLAKFVRFWRQHFLDTMKPAYLSSQWNVNDPVNLVAGEYNPYRPEMDGS